MTNAIRKYWLENANVALNGCRALECADGFRMHVKTDGGAFRGRPKMDIDDDELWGINYPTEPEPLLDPYVSDVFKGENIRFRNVPTQTVNDIIAKHGGVFGPWHPLSKPWAERTAIKEVKKATGLPIYEGTPEGPPEVKD